MNRMNQMWASKRMNGEKCFIPFVMGGVPSIEVSRLYIQTCIEKGCGLIEIGVPCSDPIADGKMIAQVHAEGIAAGITVHAVFDLVRSLRQDYKEVPIALMLYSSMIHDMGIDSFFEACGHIGIDGVIVPDMTLAECKVFEGYAEAHNVYMIRLIASRSRHRIADSVEGAKGFLYCVSSLGVTGMRESFGEEVEHFLEEVRAQTELPLAVGFGIAKPCHVTQLIPYVDAVIVGSAIAHAINKKRGGDEEALTDFLEEMIQTLKK
ncbi:MAG: tryptophan synthase subunit alpha [Cellulosilyticaceae bacterium]